MYTIFSLWLRHKISAILCLADPGYVCSWEQDFESPERELGFRGEGWVATPGTSLVRDGISSRLRGLGTVSGCSSPSQVDRIGCKVSLTIGMWKWRLKFHEDFTPCVLVSICHNTWSISSRFFWCAQDVSRVRFRNVINGSLQKTPVDERSIVETKKRFIFSYFNLTNFIK